MNRRARTFVEFALALGVFVPTALAQKPSAPPPPPPSSPPPTSPGQPTNPGSLNSPTVQPDDELVMYLLGRVATGDGTNLPTNVMVERVCNTRVRQQVYVAPGGDFSMQLGSMTDSSLDASADGTSQAMMPNRFTGMGIPRSDLENCELRASVAGFESPVISLVALDASAKSIQVGTIVVHRRGKVQDKTVNAAAYKGPKDAVSAYDKGLDAERGGKLESARKYFEKAVAINPTYAHAWYQLGFVLQNQDQKDAASKAFTQAVISDAKYLPPYLSLTVIAFQAENWKEVLRLTNTVLSLDPFKEVAGYAMDLDPFDFAEAYFYNGAANYRLDNFADAERSALKAEHMLTRTPQVHLLLSEILARKKDYTAAISELQIYLELRPHGPNSDQVRERLAELQKQDNLPSSN